MVSCAAFPAAALVFVNQSAASDTAAAARDHQHCRTAKLLRGFRHAVASWPGVTATVMKAGEGLSGDRATLVP